MHLRTSLSEIVVEGVLHTFALVSHFAVVTVIGIQCVQHCNTITGLCWLISLGPLERLHLHLPLNGCKVIVTLLAQLSVADCG